MADGIIPEQNVPPAWDERFVSISVSVAGDPAAGVVVYFAAVDRAGRTWWWDTKQPTLQWQALPPHPRQPTSGAVP
jgi:hypothetical protein